MSLVYIDVLRIVSPLEKLDKDLYDFYLLGGFDAMKVDLTIDSLRGLQDRQRERHVTVPIRYDRQPLYLYSNETKENLEATIFSRNGAYRHKPLVMTLFQLDNHKDTLAQGGPLELMKTLRDCIENECESIPGCSDIDFHVFLCLGESDCVVIFRGDKISNIGKLVFSLRSLQAVDQDKKIRLRVLSTCSHCAFPCTDTVESDFKQWLENDNELQLFTMVNTSYGLRNIGAIETLNKFLFGEWDYRIDWIQGDQNIEKNAKFYMDWVAGYLEDFDPAKPGPFRTAYTVPVIHLTQEEKAGNEGATQILSDISYITQASKWIEKIEPNKEDRRGHNRFRDLKQAILEMDELYGSGAQHLAKTVVSLGGTITGLAKHLYRLLCGRFEQDLYAFVRPVFDDLLVITKDTTDKIRELYKFYVIEKDDVYSAQISLLLDDYVHDTSELLSQLQHLFSVLSVSPYTYLETYGSNMRSLAATCKLVVAYQGITYCLGQIFSENQFNENGEPFRMSNTALVLPYRNITSNNRLLFPHTSLKTRLSYIQLDFMEMFDVPNALFVLLHECGHQFIGHSMRKKCAESYVYAVIADLLHRSLGYSFKDVEKSVSRPLKGGRRLFISEDVAQISSSRIRNKLHENCGAICDGYWRYYEEYQVEMNAVLDPLSLKNMVLDDITEALKQFLDTLILNDWESLFPIFQRLFHINYTTVRIMIQRLRESNEEDGCFKSMELRDAIFLEQFYYVPDPEDSEVSDIPDDTKRRIERTSKQAQMESKRVSAAICDEMNEVYGDIYSDIFAIELLGLGCEKGTADRLDRAQKYVELIIRMAGALRNEIILETGKLIRVRVVLGQCYCIEETSEIISILKKIGIPDRIFKKAENLLDSIKSSLYYEEIAHFAKMCQEELIQKRNDLTGSGGNFDLGSVSQMLQEMYGGQTDSVISNIYYFWKVSTQREEAELA